MMRHGPSFSIWSSEGLVSCPPVLSGAVKLHACCALVTDPYCWLTHVSQSGSRRVRPMLMPVIAPLTISPPPPVSYVPTIGSHKISYANTRSFPGSQPD